MGEQEGGNPKAKVTAVYKMNQHCTCDGCVKKIHHEMKAYDGVEQVKFDPESIVLTVTGNVDPDQLKNKLAEKTNKKIDLISTKIVDNPSPPKKDGNPSPPKKDGDGNPPPKKDGDGKKEPKKDGDGKKPPKKDGDGKKPPKECMLDLKITPYCDGCMRNLRKVILEFDGCKSYCQGCKSYCQGCSTCQEARKKDH